MRKLLFILTILISSKGHSQNQVYDSYISDTVLLPNINFKKLVSYKLDSVTILVNYYDFKKELSVYWKRYKEGMKETGNAKSKGEYINPEYEPRWKTIDSVYRLIQSLVKTQDTIFLHRSVFDKVGLAGDMNNFFPNLIDRKQCLILDEKNQIQHLIIRRKGSKISEPLGSYGGRAYYLPGKTWCFVEARDWMT